MTNAATYAKYLAAAQALANARRATVYLTTDGIHAGRMEMEAPGSYCNIKCVRPRPIGE